MKKTLFLIACLLVGLVPLVHAQNPNPALVQKGVTSAGGSSHTTLSVALTIGSSETAIVVLVGVTGTNPGSSNSNVKFSDTLSNSWISLGGANGNGANTAYMWAFGVANVNPITGSDTFTADLTTCAASCDKTSWSVAVLTYTNAYSVKLLCTIGTGSSNPGTNAPCAVTPGYTNGAAGICAVTITSTATSFTDTNPNSNGQTRRLTVASAGNLGVAVSEVIQGGGLSTTQLGCGWTWTPNSSSDMSLTIGAFYAGGPSDVPYSNTLSNSIKCGTSANQYDVIAKSSTGNVNGWGTPDDFAGQNSSDFTGLTLTSVTLDLCAIANDATPDPNNVIIGTYSKTNGALISTLSTFTFDSIGTRCNIGTTCTSNAFSQITISGFSHVMLSTEIIGIAFPSPATINHGVLVFCNSPCNAQEVTHGGIVAGAGGVAGDSEKGAALAGSFIFGSQSQASMNFSSAINEASLFVGIVLIILIVYYIRSEKTKEESGFILDSMLALAIFFVVLQALGAVLT